MSPFGFGDSAPPCGVGPPTLPDGELLLRSPDGAAVFAEPRPMRLRIDAKTGARPPMMLLELAIAEAMSER
jgi:hypothetical protein